MYNNTTGTALKKVKKNLNGNKIVRQLNIRYLLLVL
jgi:hypothetical protein